jgi:adenylate cyclase
MSTHWETIPQVLGSIASEGFLYFFFIKLSHKSDTFSLEYLVLSLNSLVWGGSTASQIPLLIDN